MEVAVQVAAFRWSDGALLRALKRGAAPQGSHSSDAPEVLTTNSMLQISGTLR